MILDGLILTVAGMLVAFAFLGLMSLATSAMSRTVHRWLPEEPELVATHRRITPDDAAVAVAIAAAHLHLNGTRHAQG